MQVAYLLAADRPKLEAARRSIGGVEGNGLPTTPSRLPGSKAEATQPSAAAEGDIRRGGWILILVGVLLLLVAVVLVILY